MHTIKGQKLIKGRDEQLMDEGKWKVE